MSNLSSIPGFSVGGGGGGGGGGGLPSVANNLTLIDEVSYTPDATQSSALSAEYNMCIQRNAEQFAFCTMGRGNNQMGVWAQPFTINDSNGSVTLGTPAGIRNSSGSGISTTCKHHPSYDRACWIGRQHWDGNYRIISWGVRLNANNTCEIGREVGNDYDSSGYGHPQGQQLASGPDTVYMTVYFPWNSYYSGWLRYAYNGNSHYTYQTYSITNSYSSTQHTYTAMDHYSNNFSTSVGCLLDHRDGSNGFYYTETNNGSRYGLGYGTTGIWGRQVYSQNVMFRMSNGNVLYANWGVNKYIVTNGSGSILKSATDTDLFTIVGESTAGVNTAMTNLGNDYFCFPSERNLGWTLVKLQLDGSYNLTVTPISYLFTDDGGSIPINSSRNSGMYRLAGNQQQYFLVVTNTKISVYDSSPIKSLMTI